MPRQREVSTDHSAFSELPVQMVTLGHGDAQAAVHVAGTLSTRTTPLVCVAGYQRNMSDFAQFCRLYQRLAGAEQPVVLLDLQGRGRSTDRANAGDYGSPHDVQDIMAVTDALGIPAAVFLGQGYGGQLLMALAAQRPRLLAGAILLDAGPVTDSRGIVRLRNNIAHVESLRGAATVKAGFRRMLAGDYPNAAADQLDALLGRTHLLDKRGRARPLYDRRLVDALSAFSHDDILMAQWPLFDALAGVPLLLLRTQLTDQVRRETFDEMVRRRPDAPALIIQDQGSPALLDQADEVRAIAEFVSKAAALRG